MLKFYELWNPKEGEGLGAAAALKEAQEFTSLAICVFLLLLLGAASADDEPAERPKPLTPKQAADAVLEAVRAEDEQALRALAEKNEPDPWLVADELCPRGQQRVGN